MILVTGATGNAGSQVVRQLRERGAQVRAFVRDPDRAHDLFGDDVELAVGDFMDPRSVRTALAGVDAMVLSCSDDPRRVEWETSAIDAAAAAGVMRIVKLSTIEAAPGAPVAFWDWHGQVEQYLWRSGLPAMVVRSTFYMSNLVVAAEDVARANRLSAPAGEAQIAMIHPHDVGAATAAVLTDAWKSGQTHVVTGPEAITYRRVAADLSEATGRRIEFVDVSGEAARQGMLEAGLPEFVADQVVKVFQLLRDGVAGQVTDTVERLTGNPPRSFATFARERAHLFGLSPVVAAREALAD